MLRSPHHLPILGLLALLLCLPPVSARAAPQEPAPEHGIQAFLGAQPGPLAAYRDGQRTAAEWMEGVCAYYAVSPRILLALLEATGGLLAGPSAPEELLRQPFGRIGPDGFGAQVDWAARELRAGMGPYDRPPTLVFTDGVTLTLTLEQAPEGLAVQRFLARGRPSGEWRIAYERFLGAFQRYFNNELPDQRRPQPPAHDGFLQRPWPAGTNVVHLAYFDHIFPTVDTNRGDNGFVVNYLGRGGVQYDGHDGHDFYFPDQPVGSSILAAAGGVAYARTHRGNGVVILHPGGYETVYWHLDRFAGIFTGKIDTDQGVAVRVGELLGTSGRSGFVKGTPHLHFEVRHNGREVDPYGWFGPGNDPCSGYGVCEASRWLWQAELVGEFDFTPPGVAAPDQTPPIANLTINPHADLLLLARFDSQALQQVGVGAPIIGGAPLFDAARFGEGARLNADDRLSYPTGGNLDPAAGTIAFWARLPERYPATSTGRNYLLAASANPDEGPVYTGTLALRRDMLGPDGAPRWDFWTTPESGEQGRSDLATPDTLAPGLHHFAISWDRAARSKALYLDGKLAAEARDVDLPIDVGEQLELGRFAPRSGASGTTLDELAIFHRALSANEIAQLAAADQPLPAGATQVESPELLLDLNAIDDSGGIMSVRIGVDGVFEDPQPYAEGYRLRLPAVSGTYTIAARLVDRAGNETTVSSVVMLNPTGKLYLPLLTSNHPFSNP